MHKFLTASMIVLALAATSCRGHKGNAGAAGQPGGDGPGGENGIGFNYSCEINGSEIQGGALIVDAATVVPAEVLALADDQNAPITAKFHWFSKSCKSHKKSSKSGSGSSKSVKSGSSVKSVKSGSSVKSVKSGSKSSSHDCPTTPMPPLPENCASLALLLNDGKVFYTYYLVRVAAGDVTVEFLDGGNMTTKTITFAADGWLAIVPNATLEIVPAAEGVAEAGVSLDLGEGNTSIIDATDATKIKVGDAATLTLPVVVAPVVDPVVAPVVK